MDVLLREHEVYVDTVKLITNIKIYQKKKNKIFFHAYKTTELAAAIIPVMILHGLHTDSTYHSPLRETFVKDIREDFSNLVHCNLA